ncbi:hypothetical protein NXS98_09720 [Fontisphaera persica]|uniref:hypothetical protein n=1 Tax=Fontisphaera persica TaxID=2974023 RepID=UPI0024C014B2|nr:hypothetical protein [Fontisphaera persica]WCJ58005.1 hypothetical protein NXS98_09720 [Fontisphaera persica]
MSEPTPSPAQPSLPVTGLKFTVLGVGGAGGNLAALLARAAWPGIRCVALDTSWRSLQLRAGLETFLLGRSVLGGLSAGGDPKQGRAAAEASESELPALVSGADVVFLLAGLGGGTGSGAAPIIARAAKAAGAWVVAVVALPLEMEGSRRRRQAILALSRLREEADVTIPLDNQAWLQQAAEGQTVPQLLATANERLAQVVAAWWRLLALPGLIHLDLGALRAATAGRALECQLAAAEAAGDHRTFDVWAQLTQTFGPPESGAWQKLSFIVAGIAAGEDLLPAELEWLSAQIRQQAPHANLILGVACDPALQGRLLLTLMASTSAGREEERLPQEPPPADASPRTAPLPEAEAEAQSFLPPSAPRPPARMVPPPPAVPPEKARQLYRKQGGRVRGKRGGPEQGMLPLEVVSKGRFDKSDPTIRDGEDLDVPTYIRRGVTLN